MTWLACTTIAVCILVGIMYPLWPVNGSNEIQSGDPTLHNESKCQRVAGHMHTIESLIGKVKMSKVRELLGAPDRTGAVVSSDHRTFYSCDGYWVYDLHQKTEYIVYYDPKNDTLIGTRYQPKSHARSNARTASPLR